jgi:Fic family protein
MGRGGRYEELQWEPDFARTSGSRAAAGRYRAFIPAEIAEEEFVLSGGSAELAQRASAAVTELNASQGQLVSLEGLARQLLRSEALASSQIEGLSVSHRKLAEAELEGRDGHHKAKEIMANVARADDLTVDDITALHAELAIVPPLDKIAGHLREEASWIGGTAPPDAEYVGPPHVHVRPLLEDLCAFMARDDLPAIQQAAIAHAQFELIHPFGDGNGRVGRCLIHVQLRRRGLAPRYVPPVSLVLGANKDAYIAGLERYRDGAVETWVDQFSRAMRRGADHATGFSESVLRLQDEWRSKINARSDSAVFPIIDLLPQHPIVTAAVAEKEIGRTRPATITALDRLAEAGILFRHRNQKKGDSWEAKQLFALLNEFEAAVHIP